MKNNKGFSLVELIIVIAIMAILVGVMAPQLIKYIEKTNVSSDTQLCDSIKTAVTTAMMDPAVIAAQNNGIPGAGVQSTISNTTPFGQAALEILGVSQFSDLKLKSSNESGKLTTANIRYEVKSANSVHVWLENSDSTGKKKSANANIYVD